MLPRVNPEIWSSLDKFNEHRDLRTSNVQKNPAKAGTSRENGKQVDPTEFIKPNMEILAILPRYTGLWDVEIVLTYLKNLDANLR